MEEAATASGVVMALSVGAPRQVDMGGRTMLTSIVRDPVPGPLHFGVDGVPGNRTAVHTEQVLAFSAEHYDHWTRVLGLPREAWPWCWWGENLTVTGLDENSLCIGDVVTAGEAVFEVTSPRIPCFKLAWRIGQPEAVLARLIVSGRIGVYLRIVQPGWVGAGDRVEVFPSASAPVTITVGDLGRLLTDPAMEDTERLRAITTLPALGGQALGMLRKRITRLEDRARLQTGRWRGWRPFTLVKITEEAEAIRSFHLRPTDDEPLAPPAAGQFLTVRTERGEEPSLTRNWSLSDTDAAGRTYRLSIKAQEGGAASQRMHRHLQAGDVVWARPPAGQFILDRSGFRRVALISGGIGVTPMIAMLKAHLGRGQEAPPLIWLHATRNGRTHAFREEVEALLTSDVHARRAVFYSRPDPLDRLGVDFDHGGRPSLDDLRTLIAPEYKLNPFGREIEFPGVETEVYVCGPPAFEAGMRESLQEIGLDPGLIRSETFSPAGRSTGAPSPGVEQARVMFAGSGVQADWFADDGLTLLDLAEAAGLSPAYACRTGVCQTCERALTAGEVSYDPVPLVLPEAGRVLICCARPATRHVEIAA